MGFRFTLQQIAKELNVVGWVKNLKDGRVELLAESDEDTLKELLVRVEKAFHNYIKESLVSWGKTTGEFCDFSIRF